jgi:hypothetical protein
MFLLHCMAVGCINTHPLITLLNLQFLSLAGYRISMYYYWYRDGVSLVILDSPALWIVLF